MRTLKGDKEVYLRSARNITELFIIFSVRLRHSDILCIMQPTTIYVSNNSFIDKLFKK